MSLADSTSKKYSDAVLYYVRWGLAAGFSMSNLMVPSEGIVYLFAVFLARSNQADSIRNVLAGVRTWLRQFGKVDWSEFYRLNTLLRGIKMVKGSRQNVKRPVTVQLLVLWWLKFGRTGCKPGVHAALMACSLGVLGMLRRSNLVPGRDSLTEHGHYLRRQDVKIMPDQWALQISIYSSKTRQAPGTPHIIWVAGNKGAKFDPVLQWYEFCKRFPAAADAPAFTYDGLDGMMHALDFAMLSSTIKHMAAGVGLNPKAFASHSLRRGGASASLAAGLPSFLTKWQGDWRSMCYERYFTLGLQQKLSITRCILNRVVPRKQ
jgi:hypothetical protein